MGRRGSVCRCPRKLEEVRSDRSGHAQTWGSRSLCPGGEQDKAIRACVSAHELNSSRLVVWLRAKIAEAGGGPGHRGGGRREARIPAPTRGEPDHRQVWAQLPQWGHLRI